ncbi:hypothetical protein PV328_004338 [Microctonus aethiopoides]|uniref:Uncharacterized protein n=1 Tax=Microctonus aethiopoides TaxID=144406 RepID=A0AA39FAC8_9HYME|nr:hypothetical protein PV328_004338 [Microctonus aethiopoides]
MTKEHLQSGKELNLVEVEEDESNCEFIELNDDGDNSTDVSEDVEIIDNEEILNIIEAEDESLVERTGPSVQDYLLSLFEYLRTQIRYLLTNFRAPVQLQRVMEQMEWLRLPLQLWQSFINISMRIISLSGLEFNAQTLGEALILIVTIVAEFYIRSFFLKAVVAIFAYMGPTLLIQIITYIYKIFNYLATKFLEYVKKILRQFYELSAECIKNYSMPNSR